MKMPFIQTIKGRVPVDSLGLFLPHEHLFVDLRGPLTPGYGEGDPASVQKVVGPHLAEAHAKGVTALVECSTIGVGRNIAVLRYLADHTPIHIIAPTGIYREAYMPPEWRAMSEAEWTERWIADLTEGIDGTDSRAGFIKIAMSDDGPTEWEERSLRAAAAASKATGAVIGSHTIGGKAALRELAVLEASGLDHRRFIWIHAHTEPNTAVHLETIRRGAWVEFDAIGAVSWHPQDKLLEAVLALIEAGHADQILLSHDAGWYEPGQPGGLPKEGYRGYTALMDDFIPALKARGVSEDLIHQMTVANPAQAFAMGE
jgi:phosphotriesterase-related protein